MVAPPPPSDVSAGPVKDKPFKVIIVGGGVAGLALAHCLEKANVDYILLEKGVIAPTWGTSISMHPNGCRILDQIGALDEVEKYCVPMNRFFNRGPDGHPFVYDYFFKSVLERTGYTTLTLERRLFLKALYDTLEHRERVHEHQRVAAVVERKDSVAVVMQDGSEHVGDLVVGADGVHSLCRELMWKKANETIEGYISAAEKRSKQCGGVLANNYLQDNADADILCTAMKTTYVAIIANVPQMPGLGPNDMHATSFDKVSFLVLCQPDTIYLAAHFKLPHRGAVPLA
ncbi:hypothetical protein NUW58_g7001 [Xylaria curta]|uniref:Uncharacterized protein n=1 Tax=Xylaria curta TaxID=42375 RepID=A0ACC1NMU7_9PEZI|nr:hypothetical protein NUW58_g7001 [Xylaria curta]